MAQTIPFPFMYDYNNPYARRKIWENIKYGAITAIVLWLLAVATGYGQARTYTLADTPVRIDSSTGGMIYTEVVPVGNATADQLYSRAKSFLLKAFTNESSVTQMDDKATGVVGGRGKLSMNLSVGMMALSGAQSMYYETSVEIRVKDGRYRYEFSNIDVVNGRTRIQIDAELRKNPRMAQKMATKEMSEKQYEKYMSDKNPMMVLIRQLKQAMNPTVDKSDF